MNVLCVVGRQDKPCDAVEEYCVYLARSLRPQGVQLELCRIKWHENGWFKAISELRQKLTASRYEFVLFQYTALAWSLRGFPVRLLAAIIVARQTGARIGIVYHDVEPYGGTRLVDRVRRPVQLFTMKRARKIAHLSITTVPTQNVSWLPRHPVNVVFIPVGANLDVQESCWQNEQSDNPRPTIAVYGVTGGPAGNAELDLMVRTITRVSERIGKVKLLLFGRNTDSPELEKHLASRFAGLAVEFRAMGYLPAGEVVQQLKSSHLLLFVRGPISSRRGSAIAGIACGLPVVGLSGRETAFPITRAGTVLLPSTSGPTEFGEAVLRVLADTEYRAGLAKRSREAQKQYFSWEAIASRYLEVLG